VNLIRAVPCVLSIILILHGGDVDRTVRTN
jgi:hypothetical protein